MVTEMTDPNIINAIEKVGHSVSVIQLLMALCMVLYFLGKSCDIKIGKKS